MKKQLLLLLIITSFNPQIILAMEESMSDQDSSCGKKAVINNLIAAKRQKTQSPNSNNTLLLKNNTEPSNPILPNKVSINYEKRSDVANIRNHNQPSAIEDETIKRYLDIPKEIANEINSFLPQLPPVITIPPKKQLELNKEHVTESDLLHELCVDSVNNNNQAVLNYQSSLDGSFKAYVLASQPSSIHLIDTKNKTCSTIPTNYAKICELKFSPNNSFLVINGMVNFEQNQSYDMKFIYLSSRLQNNNLTSLNNTLYLSRVGDIYADEYQAKVINLYEQHFYVIPMSGGLLASYSSNSIRFIQFLSADTIIALCGEAIKFIKWSNSDWETINTIELHNKINNRTPIAAALSPNKATIAVMCANITRNQKDNATFTLSNTEMLLIDLNTGEIIKRAFINSKKCSYTKPDDRRSILCAFIDQDKLIIQLPHELSIWWVNPSKLPTQLFSEPSTIEQSFTYNQSADSLAIINPQAKSTCLIGIKKYLDALQSYQNTSYSAEKIIFLQSLSTRLSMVLKKPFANNRTPEEQKLFKELTRLLLQWPKQRQQKLALTDDECDYYRSLILRPETQD